MPSVPGRFPPVSKAAQTGCPSPPAPDPSKVLPTMSKAVTLSTTSAKAGEHQPAASTNVIPFRRKATPRVAASAGKSDKAMQLELLRLMDEVIACLVVHGSVRA